MDIGPGNCLIDQWIRTNSKNKNKYDKNGKIAKSGKINKKILIKALNNWKITKMVRIIIDIKDFDLSFVKGLSLEDGAATLTELLQKFYIEILHF